MKPGYYIVILLGVLTITLGVVAGVNRYADANGVYSGNARQEEARRYVIALLKSPHGLVAHNDERSIKFELARQTDAMCYTTGSSHEMEVSMTTFPPVARLCRNHINLGLAGGTYEDFVTSISIILTHRNVKHIFIGIQPWMFRWNADVRLAEQLDVNNEARRALGLTDTMIGSDHFDMLTNLFSGSYFIANIKRLTRNSEDTQTPVFKATDNRGRNLANDENVFRPDGSFRYSVDYLAATPTPIGKVGAGEYKISKPYLDRKLTAEFESLLAQIRARGIDMTFLLMPYHPKVWDCTRPDVCDALLSVEHYARTLAKDKGIAVIGGYDPRPMGLKAEDFYDVMHVSGKALKRVR